MLAWLWTCLRMAHMLRWPGIIGHMMQPHGTVMIIMPCNAMPCHGAADASTPVPAGLVSDTSAAYSFVDIWMQFQGLLSERSLDLALRGRCSNAQDIVVGFCTRDTPEG